MTHGLTCAFVFILAYLLNVIYITVFYHRGLTHGAVKLHPMVEKFVILTGSWITGLDPKGWACMHRLHHLHSDTKKDPHSPVFQGIWKVLPMQLYSYNKTLTGLIAGKRYYTEVVKDLQFPVNRLIRNRLWYLPYLLHAVIAVLLGVFFHSWLLAGCYWVGMMSHPIQGWMVNALAHRFGYRNFSTGDNSKNNSFVAWLVFGEGYQNNHHYRPHSPKFSVKWWEIDLGYGLCLLLASLGFLRLHGTAGTSPSQ